jgi:hypothetical protein
VDLWASTQNEQGLWVVRRGDCDVRLTCREGEVATEERAIQVAAALNRAYRLPTRQGDEDADTTSY